MPSQISGQAPKPSKNIRRPARKPKAVGLTGDIAAMGGSAAKSAGHMAHDAVHGAKRIVKSLNPFD
jgi:hypothetical protein